MDSQYPGKELIDDVCVFCGEKLSEEEGCISASDGACCAGCRKEMELEPLSEGAMDGE